MTLSLFFKVTRELRMSNVDKKGLSAPFLNILLAMTIFSRSQKHFECQIVTKMMFINWMNGLILTKLARQGYIMGLAERSDQLLLILTLFSRSLED